MPGAVSNASAPSELSTSSLRVSSAEPPSMRTALASAVRALSGSTALTRSELVLSTLGALALLIAPGVYGVRYLARRVWPITPRVVETAARLQRALVASMIAYALIGLGARVLATFAQLGTVSALSPSGALLAFSLACASAAFGWWLPGGRKRS